MEPGWFEIVRDAFEGFVPSTIGRPNVWVHSRGLKAWFGDETREHYEAQLIRTDDGPGLEIGFHTEHPKPVMNDDVLRQLLAAEPNWRPALGDEAVAGGFIGRAGWQRVSELWPPPASEPGDPAVDEAIEVAARLADYVTALEPARRAARTSQ